MRRTLGRLVVVLLAAATVAVGSWLLVADPSLGRNAPGAQAGVLPRRAGVLRPLTHGYQGYSPICQPALWQPMTRAQEFIRGGTVRCFTGNGNQTGDNPDLSIEGFLVDVTGRVTNMTKDTRRCVEGPNQGQSCAQPMDCPEGGCQDAGMLDCAADGRGRTVFFIFDGDPTGENPDLGDELFMFDTRKGQLVQMTSQRGWCNGDFTKVCDKSSDCGMTDRCVRARMEGGGVSRGYGGRRLSGSSGLEVSGDGRYVWFLSDGDPGGNPSHAVTQFVLVTRGRSRGLKAVGSAGRYCAANTANRGLPCVSPEDCGPVCGDGKKDPTEQCDPGANPSTCRTGQYCASSGSTDQCTCKTPQCGNGIREPGEFCELGTTKFCPPMFHCSSDCRTCLRDSSPSGAFP
jgi:hypothetical protein